ncbi:MAG: ABC transporter ATP-binding protein [Christensenellaceae bacterium]|jgi:sn-glycerol 3-phosphate transport system ATP-binding protein|nr:ABC transporter ATP-binding protein [Christensenellaceae bacterium]
MAIILEGVKKIYPGTTEPVMEDFNLTIKDGSFTVLLGPSGCGKTTALRMIAGLEEVTAGKIYIDGADVTTVDPGARNIAMVFQNYAIYPHMTVRGNIEFGLKNYKITKAKIQERVNGVLAQTGLTDLAGRMPAQLSGGQRQRVALARAMSKSPMAFLMDEPLSNLDAKLRSQMRSELIQLFDALGVTFIYVTHDQTEALTMATDIVVMYEGRIMQQGTPQEVYENPANIFVAQFIGDPGMNVLKLKNEAFVGFKPRALRLVRPANGDFEIAGQILTREFLGHEYMYTIDVGCGRIVLRTGQMIDAGTTHTFYADAADLCYFDKNQNRTFEPQQAKVVQVFHVDE